MKRLALIVLFALLTACGSNASPIVIEWTTATEINTAGFNLYRGDSANGPFTQINSQLIPASPDPVAGGKYKYEDASVAAGKTYYYQLEDIEYSGTRTKHPPVAVSAGTSFGMFEALLASVGIIAVGFVVWIARKR
ncbi:MAG: hypothetical protein HZB51_26745 [Chloroflexi bacterium]|nr:hypothetical protein [Chloroflexota bacterium]